MGANVGEENIDISIMAGCERTRCSDSGQSGEKKSNRKEVREKKPEGTFCKMVGTLRCADLD